MVAVLSPGHVGKLPLFLSTTYLEVSMSQQTGFLCMMGAWILSGAVIGIMCAFRW